MIKTHSIKKIAAELNINGDIEEAAAVLDLYYLAARYPDAIYDNVPYESFTKKMAKEALEYARLIFNFSKSKINE